MIVCIVHSRMSSSLCVCRCMSPSSGLTLKHQRKSYTFFSPSELFKSFSYQISHRTLQNSPNSFCCWFNIKHSHGKLCDLSKFGFTVERRYNVFNQLSIVILNTRTVDLLFVYGKPAFLHIIRPQYACNFSEGLFKLLKKKWGQKVNFSSHYYSSNQFVKMGFGFSFGPAEGVHCPTEKHLQFM